MNLRIARAALALVALAAALATAARADEAADRDALIRAWSQAQAKNVAGIKNAKQRSVAQQTLESQLKTLEAAPPAAAAPPAGLAALARRELAVPGRYDLNVRKPGPPPVKPWWERLMDWIGDRWGELMRALFGRASIGHGQAVAIGDVLLVIVAALLAIVAYRLIAQLSFERRARRERSQALPESADAAAIYARACERARAGDFGMASKLLFVATIAALDLRGVVRDDRSATVGDLRRAVRSRNAALTDDFDAVARVFVTSAYAERPVGGDEWEGARRSYLDLSRNGGNA